MRPSGIVAARVRDASIASIFFRITEEMNASDQSETPRILIPSDLGRRSRS